MLLGHRFRPFCALLLALMFAGLAGCGREPPGCADAETVSLVKQTFWDSVAKRAVDAEEKTLLATVQPKFDVSLEAARVAEKRADAAKVFCVATLKVALGGAASQTVDKMFKRESAAEVEYSSQLTADGKEHIVELAGHDNPVEYVWSLAKMGALGRAESAATPALGPSAPKAEALPAPQPTVPASGAAQASPAPAAPVPVPAMDFAAADKALNAAYQAARDSMTDAKRAALRDEQRAWIKRRDDACSEERIRAETKGDVAGGTAMEMERTACMTKLTAERTNELEGLRR